MRTRPGLFQGVIAVSPWLVWDKRKGLAPLTAFLSGGGVRTRALFFTSGDEGEEMRDVLGQVSAALKSSSPKNLRWSSAHFPGEHHDSVVLPEPLRSFPDDLRRLVDPLGPGDGAAGRVAGRREEAIRGPERALRLHRDAAGGLGQPPRLPGARAEEPARGPRASSATTRARTPSPRTSTTASETRWRRAACSTRRSRASRRAAELGQKSGDPNAKVFKANADRVRVRLATQASEAPARRQ